jgi:general secretion pathway protein F
MGAAPVIQIASFEDIATALDQRLGEDQSSTVEATASIAAQAATGNVPVWTAMADRVRHGGKLSDALTASAVLPPVSVRMLRLGEETGQLPTLAARVAEFYEAKLQRQLDRIVGIIGPAAIVTISIVVGGLIVSMMTALLSVTQVVG